MAFLAFSLIKNKNDVLHHYYSYHVSSMIDFSSEKYICSTGHKDSWYLQSNFSEDA